MQPLPNAAWNVLQAWPHLRSVTATPNRVLLRLAMAGQGLAGSQDVIAASGATAGVGNPWQFDQRLYWNSIGELDSVWTQVDGVGQTVRFGYDGWGRRARKWTNVSDTRYFYDGENVVTEHRGASRRHYTYYPGTDRPHSVWDGSERRYYITDSRANVTGLINAAGNVVAARYRYTPFGQIDYLNASFADNIRLAGREYDPETGLYFNRARYYDAALNRFISEDPIGLEGGLNTYAYAWNDPINGRDPSGRFANFIIGGVIGFGLYAITHLATGEQMTWGGAIAATATGALTSGIGTVARAATTTAKIWRIQQAGRQAGRLRQLSNTAGRLTGAGKNAQLANEQFHAAIISQIGGGIGDQLDESPRGSGPQGSGGYGGPTGAGGWGPAAGGAVVPNCAVTAATFVGGKLESVFLECDDGTGFWWKMQ